MKSELTTFFAIWSMVRGTDNEMAYLTNKIALKPPTVRDGGSNFWDSSRRSPAQPQHPGHPAECKRQNRTLANSMPRSTTSISIITNLASGANKTDRNTPVDKVRRTYPADGGTVVIAFEGTLGSLRVRRKMHDSEMMEGKVMGSRIVWHDMEAGGW